MRNADIESTEIPGCEILRVHAYEDERGRFSTMFDAWEATEYGFGVGDSVAQVAISENTRKGTLRGMHYQLPPYEQGKLVKCLRGAIHDVCLDLRPGPTFGMVESRRLAADNGLAMWIPKGCAHGFQTLEEYSTVVYVYSKRYMPQAQAGVRYDDPKFNIRWPLPVSLISRRDTEWLPWSAH